FIAKEENGKSARGDGLYRRDFRNRTTRERLVTIQKRPGAGSEKRLAEPGILSETGVVAGRFAEVGEGGFGNHCFNASIGGSGLQHDAGAHGFTECEDMFGVFARFERVDDGAGVVAL